jgi:hypothetical protein
MAHNGERFLANGSLRMTRAVNRGQSPPGVFTLLVLAWCWIVPLGKCSGETAKLFPRDVECHVAVSPVSAPAVNSAALSTVHPREIDDVLANPYCGWGVWAGPGFFDRCWRDHQLIAEGNWSYEQVKKDKTHGSVAEHVDAFVRFHSSYAHLYLHSASYRQAMADDRVEFERALRSRGVGYRFVLASAAWESVRGPGQTLTLRQEWVNRNASWCVYPYRLRLFLLNSSGQTVCSDVDHAFDPRPWLAGTNYPLDSAFQLPADLKAGTYGVRIALVDETGKPQVRLGIEGADSQMRYRLGSLTMTNAHD